MAVRAPPQLRDDARLFPQPATYKGGRRVAREFAKPSLRTRRSLETQRIADLKQNGLSQDRYGGSPPAGGVSGVWGPAIPQHEAAPRQGWRPVWDKQDAIQGCSIMLPVFGPVFRN